MSQLENKPIAARSASADGARLPARIGRMLTRNVPNKIFAVLLAALLWSVLIASDDTLMREKVFTGVEVTVAGEDELKARGLIVIDDLNELVPNVRIHADVAQGSFDRIVAGSFSPRINLSRVQQAGEQEVPITVPPVTSAQVLEVDPSRVVFNVEEYVTVGRIPVVVELTGKARPDLWVDTPRSDPITVSVGGPRPLVDLVAKVVAELDLGTLTGDDRVSTRTAVHFMPQDAAGTALDSPLLQVSSNDGVKLDRVNVDVSWYPQREIPLDLASAVLGEPAEGYELVSVTTDPVGVAVAAPQGVLDELSRAFVEPIDITDATGTVSAPARVRRMSDARFVNMEEVVVTAVISEQRIERHFRNLPIEVHGLPDDYSARLRNSRTGTTIIGGYHWVNQLQNSDLTLYVDVSDLPPGEHEALVEVSAQGSANFYFLADEETVTVTLTQR